MNDMTQHELHDLIVSRDIPAPIEAAWKSWTEPDRVLRWWGPNGFTCTVAELDVRVGGRFRIVFGGPDGKMHECAGTYKEVVPNKKLVFTWSWPNSTPERISVVTIEFRVAGKGTDLLFKHEQLFDEAARDGHKRGWTGALDKLGEFLNA